MAKCIVLNAMCTHYLELVPQTLATPNVLMQVCQVELVHFDSLPTYNCTNLTYAYKDHWLNITYI